MKKFLLILALLSVSLSANAYSDDALVTELRQQKRINDVGFKILNANKIEKRVVFAYNDEDSHFTLLDPKLTRRQVVFYQDGFRYTSNNDELAAYLAREIAIVTKTYNGVFRGGLRSLQIGAAPKKFEIAADKQAVDFMVNAGYNPIGLITFIQKSCPQRKYDTISRKNLASKRLAVVYEYIYAKYPYYLANNKYLYSPSYQNFLLTSQNNRRMLEEKIKSGSKERLRYE